MASGFGLHGNVGRCYPMWMEFSECMSQCESPVDCVKPREDYFECLHHKKEYSRVNKINREKERQVFKKEEPKAPEHH